MEKNKNVPKLRFPEFTGEWEEKKLGEIAEFINGKAYKQEELLVEGKYPVLRVGNFFSNSSWYYSDLELEENKYCDNGDLLYAWSASFGPKIWVGNKTIYHYHIWKVLCSKYVQTKYLFYVLDEQTLRIKTNSSNGLGLLHITKNTIENWITVIPSLTEQTKIASFLTAVDEKLTQLKKKKTLLEQYKKGIMQKLFSQELRFKDDNNQDFPDWQEKTLGELSNRIINKNKENNLNVLTISAQNGLVSQLEFFNKSVSAKDVTGYYLLSRNDFAYNKSYSNGYPMGAIKRLNRYEKGVVSTLYICFRNKPSFDNSFAEQYFETGLQNIELEKVAQEGARNHGLLNIGVLDFFKIELTIPSLPEQQKIATFLSSIDEKISHSSAQIEKMEDWKKGLLQQMFV